MIWSKPYSVGFLSANQRPLRSHEHILDLLPQVRARERRGAVHVQSTVHRRQALHPQKPPDPGSLSPARQQRCHLPQPRQETPYERTDVRTRRSQPASHRKNHVGLLRWIVRSYTHPGELVLDPFMGSGSTGAACALEGRRFVGMEMDESYFAVAENRLRV